MKYKKILALKLDNVQRAGIQREITQSLKISYTESKGKNDKDNKTKGMERLKKQLEKGSTTKSENITKLS